MAILAGLALLSTGFLFATVEVYLPRSLAGNLYGL